ncbi:DNA integrity scanning protein DisA nucleotide-binding domain protein [Bacillus cereus group sp. N12]|uniref:tetratricopeptide repeat protein n=1 Tax=Bacillus cereus group sp. N12 TaxID=2794586 RepID=UPI0018F66B56|nr:diadenylate cyclase [Bacillus cereus group sp. N12]MBJ8077505.1 DNA integrity scanning protein DisA nucleotide-binding domain protein [Bacillus cereus group sp. N12]
MGSFFKDINILNKQTYIQLNEILKMLDKKLDLKIYSIVLDKNDSCKEILRVKKTLSSNNNSEIEVSQENLNELPHVYNELGLDVTFTEKQIRTEFKNYCNLQKYLIAENELQDDGNSVDVEEDNMKATSIQGDNSRILYMNSFNIRVDNGIGTVNYVIEIRNVDLEVIDLFYNTPDLSFLRMALDYFFIDYFVENETKTKTLKIGENQVINKKYNEDCIQFNRRITRLYFGKLQEILYTKSKVKELTCIFNNELNNQYYINNMLENIDNISNHTYEGNSPFGSILFFNSEILKNNVNLVNYTIKFQSDDLVALNDAKLIRKLLEMTNNENDLYLISDHEMIYGLGEINWTQLNDCILFKIEFKGLSKYNIHLITIKENESSDGVLQIENGKRIYKTSKNLEIMDKSLINVSFKSPIIGGEGYTSEKFKRILESKKFNEKLKVNKDVIEYLEQVVMYAREQKHGTMVVITDYDTAVSELKTLKKQSILIEATKITPEYIQFLTSIDGAIYFDTNGKCHAIGVILDGIAKENIGDARRGARYNSAYRYLEKLKEDNKNCIIVIISEDGMVNLIPETDSEEKIYELFRQLIDLIKEDNKNSESKINRIEKKLINNKDIEYHLFFNVAEIYRGKECYEKAIEHYERGLEAIGRNIILVDNYRYLSKLYFYCARNEEIEVQKKLCYEKARDVYEKYIVKENEKEINVYDYNRSAITYKHLGNFEECTKTKQMFYQKAFNNYTKAIELSRTMNSESRRTLLSNRSNVTESMGMIKESLEDLIEAEWISSNEESINRIMNLINNDSKWIDYCVQIILEKNDNKSKGEDLIKKLKEYVESNEEINPEVAASLERLNQ